MTSISVTAPIRVPQAVDTAAPQPAPAPSADDKVKPVAPIYFSPIVRIDPKTESAVWEVRDPETGEITQQWPPDHTAKAYRAHIPAGNQGAAAVKAPPKDPTAG
jgi:hypothetical protein